MFIDSVEKSGKYKYKVKTDALVLCVYQSDLRRYRIKENMEFSDEMYRSLLKEALIPRAKKKSFGYAKQGRLYGERD